MTQSLAPSPASPLSPDTAIHKASSPEKAKLLSEPRRAPRSPRSPTTASDSSPMSRSHPHPLSQPPINASGTQTPGTATPAPLPSPLPVQPLVKLQSDAPKDRGLPRRRSSFPPGVGCSVTGVGSPTSTADGTVAQAFPWVVGGTPSGQSFNSLMSRDQMSGYGNNLETSKGNSPWDGSLKLDEAKTTPSKESQISPSPASKVNMSLSSKAMLRTPSMERTASGSEHGWRVLLNRNLDVEGMGSIGVARLMSEVWKRGGPEAVSSQNLWPSVVMSLTLSPEHGSSIRQTASNADAASALQKAYETNIRHQESLVFAGFLANYLATTAPPAVNAFQGTKVYGESTPTMEIDLSQWTTFTPGEEWPSLSTTLPSGPGLTPRREITPNLGLPPIDLSENLETMSRSNSSRGMDGAGGLNEILAQIEENNTQRETQSDMFESIGGDWGRTSNISSTAQSSLQLGTPETNITELDKAPSSTGPKNVFLDESSSSNSPVDQAIGSSLNVSPHVSSGSLLSASTVSSNLPIAPQQHFPQQPMLQQHAQMQPGPIQAQPQLQPQSQPQQITQQQPQHLQQPPAIAPRPTNARRAPPPSQIALAPVPFIPPPPMCMFFTPAFRDLQKGKVGVWKGDLEIRGRGGGKFNVLIVGEEGSDHLWQSHTWTDSLAYPPQPTLTESCTATMIPVSTLAREGLLPVTMGMVLCDDENIAPFVQMVQGLHAEGVAFHLPLPGSGLPIVFLPAKFDATDQLQRLGVAFMAKGGIAPIPPRPSFSSEEKSKSPASPPKKRRKSNSVGQTRTSARRKQAQ